MQIETLIEQIREGKTTRELAIKSMYVDQKLRSGVNRVVKNILGSKDEFNDIFNFTLVQFLKNVLKKEDLVINTNIYSYLFGISRYLCLAKLRERNGTFKTVHEELSLVSNEINIDLQIINSERKKNLHTILSNIGVKCKEVLLYWASGLSMKESAKILGYASDSVVRKKKHSCMKALTIYLNNHPELKNQFHD